MSDNWIALVPVDPHFIPSPGRQTIARNRLGEIAPDADQIEIIVSESVRFFDCGANFQKILCPSCGKEIALDWWSERMDDDYQDGFKLDRYCTPCCNSASPLHELIYDWPQAFGCFALDVMNPRIGTLENEHRRELEEILETKLVVVYQHI
ncbi:MAG: hypothetical protein ACK5EA_16195 [Planctomycetaceae bacterium]|jgi:hypothetical protein